MIVIIILYHHYLCPSGAYIGQHNQQRQLILKSLDRTFLINVCINSGQDYEYFNKYKFSLIVSPRGTHKRGE